MKKTFKKNTLSVLTFILSVCLAFFVAMLAPKTNTKAEDYGFAMNESATLEQTKNGAFLCFETAVSNEWLSENPSETYTFGTLIYPAVNGSYDESKTLAENELALDSVNVVVIENQAVLEAFAYTPALYIDFNYILNWITETKPELAEDEDGLMRAFDKVINEHLGVMPFTAVSYAITDNGTVISNSYTTSFAEASQGGQGGGQGNVDVENIGSTIVGEEVTEEEFYKAVSFDGIVSFATNGAVSQIMPDENGNPISQLMPARFVIDGNNSMIMYPQVGVSLVIEITDNGIYAYQDIGGMFMRMDVTNEPGFTIPQAYLMFYEGQIEFSDFTFVDGCYVGSAIDVFGQPVNLTYKFVDGKVAFIKTEKENDSIIFEVGEYNEVSVTVPTDYIDGGSSGGGNSEWESLFRLENVTIKRVTETSHTARKFYGVNIEPYTVTESDIMFVDYGRQLYKAEDYYFEEKALMYDEFYAYYDGGAALVGGEFYSCEDPNGSLYWPFRYYFVSDIQSCEYIWSLANEIEPGVYEYVMNYSNEEYDAIEAVVITVVDGKMSTLEKTSTVVYKIDDETAQSGYTYTNKTTYYFFDYDVTRFDENSQPIESDWNQYFNALDNVTVKETAIWGSYERGLGGEYKFDYDRWSAYEELHYDNGQVTLWDDVYFNGFDCYVNGFLSTNSKNADDIHLNAVKYPLAIFLKNESLFTVTEEDNKVILTADSIGVPGLTDYISDVEITIIDGKISTVKYNMPRGVKTTDYIYDESTGNVTERVYYIACKTTLTFTDWGSTVIDENEYFEAYAFESLFNVYNATVSYTKEVVDGEVLASKNWQINGREWRYEYDELGVQQLIYCDGGVCYIDGQQYPMGDFDNVVNELYSALQSIAGYKNALTKTEIDGVITYSCFDVYSDFNLTITVVDGAITKIEYTERDYELDAVIKHTYEFSNRGSTVVERADGSEKIVGTYKFAYATRGDETYYVGDELLDLGVLTDITVEFNVVDGEYLFTAYAYFNGDEPDVSYGFWKFNGNEIMIGGNYIFQSMIISGDGALLTFYQDAVMVYTKVA